jgi:transcriptional regulator NrdR family protein
MAESAPWAVGELVMEALSTVDPVAYIVSVRFWP